MFSVNRRDATNGVNLKKNRKWLSSFDCNSKTKLPQFVNSLVSLWSDRQIKMVMKNVVCRLIKITVYKYFASCVVTQNSLPYDLFIYRIKPHILYLIYLDQIGIRDRYVKIPLLCNLESPKIHWCYDQHLSVHWAIELLKHTT